MSQKRGIAHYRADTRRTLKDWAPNQIKTYGGRHIIHVLVADEEYQKRTGQPLLAPSVRKALELMRDLALDK